jgi:glycosyltransferase involved in cell wall biosynthesis
LFNQAVFILYLLLSAALDYASTQRFCVLLCYDRREGDTALRIAIDIRPALKRGTGVGTFVEQLVIALDALDGDHSLALFTSSSKDRWPADRLPSLCRSQVFDRRWPVKLLNLLWNRLGRPHVERFVGLIDVAHSPTPLLLPSRAARIVTLHDLYFLRRPEHTRAEIRRDYPSLVRKHSAAADAVIAVSEATKSDAMELLGLPPERIIVCGEDAAPLFDKPPTAEELSWSREIAPEPFLLFVGTIEPRKNLPALLRAYGWLQSRNPELRLVIAGERGWGLQEFEATLAAIPNPGRVTITGYLEQTRLRALYHRAVALVMTSHCEGFGLPLVEAMACGCPLIAARHSSLPEVAGDAALYWKGGEEDDLAGLLEKVCEDSEVRERLIAKGRQRRRLFSWRRSAEKVLDLYRELAGAGG